MSDSELQSAFDALLKYFKTINEKIAQLELNAKTQADEFRSWTESEGNFKRELEAQLKEGLAALAERVARIERAGIQESDEGPAKVTPPQIPGDTGRYVLWLDPDSNLVNSPRFVHFSWDGEDPMAFVIRDFIGGHRQHHPGGNGKAERPAFASSKECPLDRDQVWNSARLWINANRANDLFVPVTEQEFWRNKLTEMTDNWGDWGF